MALTPEDAARRTGCNEHPDERPHQGQPILGIAIGLALTAFVGGFVAVILQMLRNCNGW
jgi:hypothetical protein